MEKKNLRKVSEKVNFLTSRTQKIDENRKQKRNDTNKSRIILGKTNQSVKRARVLIKKRFLDRRMKRQIGNDLNDNCLGQTILILRRTPECQQH